MLFGIWDHAKTASELIWFSFVYNIYFSNLSWHYVQFVASDLNVILSFVNNNNGFFSEQIKFNRNTSPYTFNDESNQLKVIWFEIFLNLINEYLIPRNETRIFRRRPEMQIHETRNSNESITIPVYLRIHAAHWFSMEKLLYRFLKASEIYHFRGSNV